MRDDTVQELATAVQSFNQTTMDRLRAKYLPSSLEISEIELFIRDAETTLTTYDKGVQGLEQLREDTAKAIDNARALSVSVRKLAPEILQQIFSYCIDSYCVTEYLFHALPYPTICLSSVCLFWRDLVWAQPSLWTRTLISIPMLLQNPKHLDLLHHYLVQSGTLSLDIVVVHQKKSHSGNNDSLIREMFHTLIKNRSRWGRFTSFFDSRGELDAYCLSPPGDFPSLKYLQCCSGLPPSQLLYSSQLQYYGGARLDVISENGHHLFPTLIELVVGHMQSCYTMKNVLRRMPFLKKLVLSHFTGPFGGPGTTPYASEISAMSLSLDAILGFIGQELLQLPCLRTLELGNLTPWKTTCCFNIRRFSKSLHNIGPILHTVKLESIPNNEAAAFLALHPSISDLTLCMPYVDSMVVFDALDISWEDTDIVLPNLRSLSIAVSWFFNNDFDDPPEMEDDMRRIEDGICQIVESRTNASIYKCKGVVRLETLTLEKQLWSRSTGKALDTRLSDRLTTLVTGSEHFRVQAYHPWVRL